MKARTLLIGGAAAAAVYVLVTRRDHDSEESAAVDPGRANASATASQGVTARRVVAQIEDKSRYAPFPFDLILQAAAKLVGHRMDR